MEASLPGVPAADTSSTEVGDKGKAWQVVASTDRHLKLPAHVIIGDGCFRCFNHSRTIALVSDAPSLKVRLNDICSVFIAILSRRVLHCRRLFLKCLLQILPARRSATKARRGRSWHSPIDT